MAANLLLPQVVEPTLDDLHVIWLRSTAIELGVAEDQVTNADGSHKNTNEIFAAIAADNVQVGGADVDDSTKLTAFKSAQLTSILERLGEAGLVNAAKLTKALKIKEYSDARSLADHPIQNPIVPGGQGNPGPAGAPPVVHSSSTNIPSLGDRLKIASFCNKDDKAAFLHAAEDLAKLLGIYDKVKALLAGGGAGVALEDAEKQKCERLKLELRGALSVDINRSLDREIHASHVENSITGVWKWAESKFVELGEAQHVLDDSELEKFTWKKSKKTLQEWAAELRSKMEDVKDRNWPTALAFATAYRKKILSNVQRNVPEIANFLSEAENRSPVEAGGRPEDIIKGLVQRMAKHLDTVNKSPEQSCDVFACDILSPAEIQAHYATEMANLKQQNAELQSEVKTMWTGNGKGTTHNPKHDKWCKSCADYHRARGALHNGWGGKVFACRHDASECKFANDANGNRNTGGAPPGTPRNKGGVQKGFEKKGGAKANAKGTPFKAKRKGKNKSGKGEKGKGKKQGGGKF